MATKTQMYGYRVQIDRYCDHEEREDREWGSWSASYTNRLNNSVRRDDQYPDVVAPFELKDGANALIVWAEWSSGDSFGKGTRSGSEAIGIFKDMRSAEALCQQLNSLQGNTYDITTPDGQRFKSGFAPWSGYFDSLEDIHIGSVVVW